MRVTLMDKISHFGNKVSFFVLNFVLCQFHSVPDTHS